MQTLEHCPQERDEARASLETAAAAAPVANGKRAADEDIEQPTKKVIFLLVLFFHDRIMIEWLIPASSSNSMRGIAPPKQKSNPPQVSDHVHILIGRSATSSDGRQRSDPRRD